MMAKLSKKTCCKELGLLGHLLNLGLHSHPSSAKIALSLEEIQRSHSFAKGRPRDPTSVKKPP